MNRMPPSDTPDPQDDDHMSIAAKMFAKYDYFTLTAFELGEQVLDIKEPWTIWDFEVIGETADYFVLWKWNADECNYFPGLMKKSEMPQQMADYNESIRRLDELKKTPEIIARERVAMKEALALKKGGPAHESVEKLLANADIETKKRTVVYSAQDTFNQPFIFVTCPKTLEGMEIIGASEEYVLAWKETDGKITAIAKRWADLGVGYELLQVPIPIAPSAIITKIKWALGKVFGGR